MNKFNKHQKQTLFNGRSRVGPISPTYLSKTIKIGKHGVLLLTDLALERGRSGIRNIVLEETFWGGNAEFKELLTGRQKCQGQLDDNM